MIIDTTLTKAERQIQKELQPLVACSGFRPFLILTEDEREYLRETKHMFRKNGHMFRKNGKTRIISLILFGESDEK